MSTASSQQAFGMFSLNSDSSRKSLGISLPVTPPALALCPTGGYQAKPPGPAGSVSKSACPYSGLKSGSLTALCSPGSSVTEHLPLVHRVGNAVACEKGVGESFHEVAALIPAGTSLPVACHTVSAAH